MPPKISAESKLRSCDTQGFRSKSSSGVGGISKLNGSLEPSGSDTSTVLRNEMDYGTSPRDRSALLEQKAVAKGRNKSNINKNDLPSSPSTVIKAKVSRAPRTGSIMMLDSSLKVQSSPISLQGSSSMAQWVGQRPKNSRTRRSNIVPPVSGHVEAQISSQGFPTYEFSARTSSGTNGFLVANSINDQSPKFKREIDIGLSESEESGAGESKTKERGANSGEVAPASSQKVGAFLLPSRKSKLPTNEIGDGVRRQGRSGRGPSLARPGIHVVRDKLENIPTGKPLQSVKAVSDKNKSKTGRPPFKKLKDRKSSSRMIPILNSGSLDYTGESEDDREELFMAANSARDACNRANCGPFWKKMESMFSSLSSEDLSFLKQQLSFSEELDESLSQMLGGECSFLGVLVHKELPDYCGERQDDDSNHESVKKFSLYGKLDMGRWENGAPLYQRVLSALIEEDESEEYYIHCEGKNIPLHYASDDSHCDSCNLIDIDPRDRDRMESEVESTVDFQSHMNSFLDRISCDKSTVSNTNRNPSMSTSLHSNERWPGEDEFSHSDFGHTVTGEICSNDLNQLQTRESIASGFPSDDQKYQLMSLDDKVLLELQSIGLCPEILPDLVEREEVINQDIMELKEGLYQQIGRKKRKLGRIEKAILKGKEVERRNIEQVAMDQLIELAYRKRLACRRNNASKNVLSKVSRQVALAFIKHTLARCRKFEDTGSSCFSEPALQEVIFSTPTSNNAAKSVDNVGSGTASNTCNEVSNHHTEARGSVGNSGTFEIDDSPGEYLDRKRKRKVLIDDVIGSASSRATSSLDSPMLGRAKGKRSDRDERKTKSKPKQKSNHLSTSGNGTRRSSHSAVNPSNKVERDVGPKSTIPRDASKETDEFANLQLHELDTIGLEVTNDLSEQQDLGSWLNFDDDELQDHDSVGLGIPMDDLGDLQMMM